MNKNKKTIKLENINKAEEIPEKKKIEKRKENTGNIMEYQKKVEKEIKSWEKENNKTLVIKQKKYSYKNKKKKNGNKTQYQKRVRNKKKASRKTN